MSAGFTAKTAALVRKDLRTEFRSRETLPPMLAFVGAVTLVVSFTLPGSSALRAPLEIPPVGTVALGDVLAGFLWITILFAGLIGFARSFESERDDGALDALLLAPVDRAGLWLSKATTNFCFVVIVEALLYPAMALLFGIRLVDNFGSVLAVTALVDIGFVAMGTVFAAVAAQTRSRELMLPVLALPALVPVFIAAVDLTSRLFLGEGLSGDGASGWLAILAVYDVVSVAIAVMAFEYVLD